MPKTITIKKSYILIVFISFISGFGILYGLEHLGKFSFTHNYVDPNAQYQKPSFETEVPYSADVSEITFTTYFNETVTTSGNGFKIADMKFADTEFKKYKVSSYYYTRATLKDFEWGFLFSIIIFVVVLIFQNVRFKVA